MNGLATVEVANLCRHGIWIFVDGKDYLFAYEHFAWFKDARVSDVLKLNSFTGTISTGLRWTWTSRWNRWRTLRGIR